MEAPVAELLSVFEMPENVKAKLLRIFVDFLRVNRRAEVPARLQEVAATAELMHELTHYIVDHFFLRRAAHARFGLTARSAGAPSGRA